MEGRRIFKFDELTWQEIKRLDKNRTIVFLSISPLEAHGPHLPVGTDVYGAWDIAEKAACIVAGENTHLTSILLPALPVGCCGVTSDFHGTITLGGATLLNLVLDIAHSLSSQGFLFLVISNHHLDPVHMKALLTAIDKIESQCPLKILESGSRIVYSGIHMDLQNRIAGAGLAFEKEVHADVKETAFIMHRHPHLLKGIYAGLPPVHIDVGAGFRKGLKTFKQMGATQGYIGSPAKAGPELGRAYLEESAALLAQLALKLYNGDPLPEMQDDIKYILKHYVRLD